MEVESERSFLKQKLLGGQSNYEAFCKLEQLNFKNSRKPTYYSEPIEEQLKMDVKLLRQEIELFNRVSVPHEIYKLLPMKGYGPGYALLVHHLYFRAFETFARKDFKDRDDIRKVKVLGTVFTSRIRTDLKKTSDSQKIKTVQKDGALEIKMDSEEWFYSRLTNIHVSAGVLIVQNDGKSFPVYVRLRNDKGQLLPHVKTKFFGHNISSQHFLIGFNLNGYIAQPSDYLDNNWKPSSYTTIQNTIQYTQLFLSLLDLCKSCDITIRYATMRRQFRTIPEKEEEERRIIQYQAVASRIAEGLATAFMVSSLLNHNKPGFTNYFQYGHRVIFHQLITLRECCGGFGYLKASGHPSLIQRVALRASYANPAPIFPIPKQTIKQYSPYITDSNYNVKFQYGQTKPKTSQNYYFVSAQYHFLEPKTPAQEAQYVYDFFKSCGIQQFQRSETWNSFRRNMTNVTDLCKYICVVEGLKIAKFTQWNIMKETSREQVLDTFIQKKREVLASISKNFQKFRECLPTLGMQDTILGREDEDAFYRQVLKVSKQNYRNSKEFIDEVKKPIAEYLRNGNQGNL